MRIIMFGLFIVALSTLRHAASTFVKYNDVLDNVRSWFKIVRSLQGVPFCDITDGHRTAYDMRTDGYWVPIGGKWQQVPAEAIVHRAW